MAVTNRDALRAEKILSIPDTALVPALAASEPEARFLNEMGQVSRHSAVFFAGTIFTTAVGYLFKLYVAHMLGAAALGVYALGMTIVGFFGLFSGLGFPQSAVRFVAAYSAKRQDDRLHGFLRGAIKLLIVANITLAGIMLLIGPWLARQLYHTPELIPFLWLFAIIFVTAAFSGFLGQVLAGYKDIARRTVVSSFIASPLNVVLGVGLLAIGMGLRGYLLAQVVSGLIVLVLLAAITWKLTPAAARRMPVQPVPLQPEVFWFSAAVFGVSALEFLLAQADKVVMGILLDVQQVGIYTIAASLVAFVPIALQSVNQIFSPTIADLHARGEHALLGRIFQTLTKWIIGFTLPLAFVMIVYSRVLMRMFGPAFEAGWLVLIVGTIAQLINTGTGSVGYLLLMSGNQRRLIRVQMIMACFMVVAILILVKPFGIVGVATASALTNAVSNFLYLREVRAALHISPYTRKYFRLLGPCAASVAVVLSIRFFGSDFQPQWFGIGVALVSSYATFCALSLAVGLDDDDRVIVAAIQKRLPGIRRRDRSL